MKPSRYDLRDPALFLPFQSAWAGAAGEDDEDDGSTDVGSDAPTPPSPADDDEPVRHPDAHRLSREAARYRRERNELQTQLAPLQADLSAAQADLATLTAERDTLHRQNAFLMAAAGHVTDLEAAWKLAADETERTPADAVAYVLDRYPYLCPADTDPGFADDDSDGFIPNPHRQASGRPANGKGGPHKNITDRAALEKKFPALKGRG